MVCNHYKIIFVQIFDMFLNSALIFSANLVAITFACEVARLNISNKVVSNAEFSKWFSCISNTVDIVHGTVFLVLLVSV